MSVETPAEQESDLPVEASAEQQSDIAVDTSTEHEFELLDEAAAEQESQMPVGAPAEQLGELVRFMATNIVESPDDVEVVVEERGSTVHISLRVPEDEMGKVIGRQGRIAKAMRTLVMVSGSRHNLRASLDIEG